MLSLRTKIILLSVLSSIFVIVVLYAIIIYTYSSEAYLDADRDLVNQIRDVINSLDFDSNAKLIMRQKVSLPQNSTIDSPKYGYVVRDKNMRIVRRSVEMIRIALPEPNILRRKRKSFSTLQYNNTKFRVYSSFYNKKSDLGRELYVIQVLVDLSYVKYRILKLNRILLWSMLITLIIVGFAAWWLATHSLKPVKQLISTIENISAKDLSARITIQTHDEIGQISAAFNNMLNRIKRAFDSLTRFTADASHELRTPLTSIRTQAEVVLTHKRSAHEYRDAISNMLEDLFRLEHLLNLLLELARSDAGLVQYKYRNCNVSEKTKQWIEHFIPLAEERKLSFNCDIEQNIFAEIDETLFERILINLIENAVEYSNKNASIQVYLRKIVSHGNDEIDKIKLQIINHGGSIADADKARIFERFVRLDQTRHRSEGSGLGLAIVKWAVEAHHGKINVFDEGSDGVVFEVILPIKNY